MYSSQSLNLISILKIPSIEELSAEDMETEVLDMPNKLYPSDHLRIEAVFQVKWLHIFKLRINPLNNHN